MVKLNEPAVIIERLRRQHLLRKVITEGEYLKLFRMMQPVSPPAFSRPGDPPVIENRVSFDDRRLTEKLRRNRIIIKARFLSGNVGYVFADQIATYGAAFRRPLNRLNRTQQLVLEVVQRIGPITSAQIKEETGFLSKEIGPALQRLQQSFLVYEDQVDSDWDRAWYDFAGEWPTINLSEVDPVGAQAEVIHEFLRAHVFATVRQISDWSGLSLGKVEVAVRRLQNEGMIYSADIDQYGEGWAHGKAPDVGVSPGVKQVVMLTNSDMLVRSHKSELKKRFAGQEVLRYLFIDGRSLGAVIGHWRIGPHDVEDIEIHLPMEQASERMDEVLSEVAKVYHPPHSGIRKYMGKPISFYL